MHIIFRQLIYILCLFCCSLLAAKETINVSLLLANLSQRTVYEDLAKKFELKHKNISIKYIALSDRQYKNNINTWLTDEIGKVDVMYWQGGERLKYYTDQSLILPIDELWHELSLDKAFSSSIKRVITNDNSVYGMPYSYYQWGFYYKKSIFKKYNLKPPKNWSQFIKVCRTLTKYGITPIGIGTKNHWPVGAWFDYLTYRINGATFYRGLMAGKIPFTDHRVRNILVRWKFLIDEGFFSAEHHKYQWNDVMPSIYREQTGMTLIGNFVSKQIPDSMTSKLGFFRFPTIKKSIPTTENAPTEIFMIPTNSTNKQNAKKFLAFISQKSTQDYLNKRLGYISPRINAEVSDDYFISEGSKVLKSSNNILQYYDRNTKKRMSDASIIVLSRFSSSPDIDKTLHELESLRLEFFPK